MKLKLSNYILFIFVFVSINSFSQIRDKRLSKFSYRSSSEWNEYDCNCYFESDFIAFINAYTELQEAAASDWLRRREEAFKNEIEDRLNKEFDNFREAQFEFFKNSYVTRATAQNHYNEYEIKLKNDGKTIMKDINRFYSKYKIFKMRYDDAVSINNGGSSIYDFGGLKYNNILLKEMSQNYALDLSMANENFYNGHKNTMNSTLTRFKGLQFIEEHEKLEEYFANLYISDYDNVDNYKDRIELMLNYLVTSYQYGNPFINTPPGFEEEYPLQLYDFSDYLADMVDDANVPYEVYNPNYSVNELKTHFVINEMFNSNVKNFINDDNELIDIAKNYLSDNTFETKNINFINDFLRRYITGGFVRSDDRADGVYASTNKSFQTEDRPRTILTFKISPKGISTGLYGISGLLEYISNNGTRPDFEGHLIRFILKQNGIDNIYHNFTNEELATLFDFTYTGDHYIKIKFDNIYNNFLDFDDIYGDSIFTDPLKVKLLKLLADKKYDIVNNITDFLSENIEPGTSTPTQEAIDFVEEVIENPDAEVDFDEGIIIDSSVDDCVKDIINKLKDDIISTSLIPQLPDNINITPFIIESFNNEKDHFLIIKQDDLDPNSQGDERNAKTSPSTEIITGPDGETEQVKYIQTITLNNSFVNNATDLAIAKTIIHEALHAFINYVYQDEIFSDFSQAYRHHLSQFSGGDPNPAQHQYMLEFADALAMSLQIWDNNSLGSTPEYYLYLSYSGGMTNTDFFQNDLTQEFQQNCINANIAEGQAGSGNQATPNAKGTKNCP